jgi:hypothetical protein
LSMRARLSLSLPLVFACAGAALTIVALVALVRTQDAYRFLVYVNPLGAMFGPYLIARIVPVGEFGSKPTTHLAYDVFLVITSAVQWCLVGLVVRSAKNRFRAI